jgi:hypothetical protein
MRRRILVGDNRGGGVITLQPIRFQCVGICISTLLPYIYIYIYIYIDRERARERESLPYAYQIPT